MLRQAVAAFPVCWLPCRWLVSVTVEVGMHATSCLEFSEKTRTVPDTSPVKRSWFCSAISRHLTWAEVSSVSRASPVNLKEISKTVLIPTARECLPSGGARDWLLYLWNILHIIHISSSSHVIIISYSRQKLWRLDEKALQAWNKFHAQKKQKGADYACVICSES